MLIKLVSTWTLKNKINQMKISEKIRIIILTENPFVMIKFNKKKMKSKVPKNISKRCKKSSHKCRLISILKRSMKCKLQNIKKSSKILISKLTVLLIKSCLWKSKKKTVIKKVLLKIFNLKWIVCRKLFLAYNKKANNLIKWRRKIPIWKNQLKI